MTDKQIIFKCDVDCIRKNTEECFELDCIKGQESILKQFKAKEQECERLRFPMQDTNYAILAKEEFEEYKKLKQTLAEIKEIVTNFYETGFLRTDDDCILINNNTCVETLDKILQKISEVENG